MNLFPSIPTSDYNSYREGRHLFLKRGVEITMSNGDWLFEELRSLRAEMQAGFRELREDIHDRLDEHSRRIRSLEAWRGWVTGAAAIIGAIVSRVLDWFQGEVK